MKIVTIELLNENTLALLQQLEQLQLLRLVINEKIEPKQPKRKWAGRLSKTTATKMLKHAEQTRNEWDRDI